MSLCENSELKIDKEINKKLIKMKNLENEEIKILLLGTSGCGKCTFLFKLSHFFKTNTNNFGKWVHTK